MTSLAEDFGANLLALRQQRGLTQGMLARIARLSRDAIYKYEKGQRMPRLDTLISLCDALCVEPDELLEGLRLSERLSSRRGQRLPSE